MLYIISNAKWNILYIMYAAYRMVCVICKVLS